MLFIFGIIDVTIDTEQLAKKFLNFVCYGPNNRKKGTMSYPKYQLSLWMHISKNSHFGHISLIINPKHFIFGIIDVTIDMELLLKKTFDFLDYGPNNCEKGTTSYRKYRLSLWTQKWTFQKWIFSFWTGIQTLEDLTLNICHMYWDMVCELKYICYMYDYNYW